MAIKSSKEHLKDCVCKNLRMTTRIVTQYFDKAFQPVGLRATQFALLADVSSRESSTIGELADILLMDQTTVTRNIKILKKKGYVNVRQGEDDSRKRCISTTESGLAKLREAINREQRFLIIEFGDEYEKYIKRSWVLIPYIF
ncbi:MarR family winged helix-turn-helix transcriptional regulator [Clostridium ljungdahlii]|uniref:MarR family protein n=1 Tax=Clostridium ljungdahlii TaxID=1538 RepID=A0A162L2Y5_9CLOT|nr:MarR family protein [Clostridium ljungdahlii]